MIYPAPIVQKYQEDNNKVYRNEELDVFLKPMYVTFTRLGSNTISNGYNEYFKNPLLNELPVLCQSR
ncbi:hypothetical protein HGG64_03155 [Mycoplasma phocoeninasale]|uniref:Uncharacterized protein n=1 Tax=Mycoplasma phocoeninasale TaxID=2726117 RepID=A0A858U0R7_9MOLU|nr:hypothetical protein [Mycoplasma phocoeninasale]QJG66674.1 hypothetical protein HGG64_03155 [Mycoplasma phocoeninasale]